MKSESHELNSLRLAVPAIKYAVRASLADAYIGGS